MAMAANISTNRRRRQSRLGLEDEVDDDVGVENMEVEFEDVVEVRDCDTSICVGYDLTRPNVSRYALYGETAFG